MSHKLIRACDGCGTERAYDADSGELVNDQTRWSTLNVTSVVPVQFDLCEECTLKAADHLKLKMPDPDKFVGQLPGGGMGGYVPMGGRVMRVGRPHVSPMLTQLSPLGGGPLVPGLGTAAIAGPAGIPAVAAPGVDPSTGTFTCPKCNSQRDCQSLNPVCITCGYQDPNPLYG